MLLCAFAGIILVLTLGVALGVAVGVIMLSVVVAYMRRLVSQLCYLLTHQCLLNLLSINYFLYTTHFLLQLLQV